MLTHRRRVIMPSPVIAPPRTRWTAQPKVVAIALTWCSANEIGAPIHSVRPHVLHRSSLTAAAIRRRLRFRRPRGFAAAHSSSRGVRCGRATTTPRLVAACQVCRENPKRSVQSRTLLSLVVVALYLLPVVPCRTSLVDRTAEPPRVVADCRRAISGAVSPSAASRAMWERFDHEHTFPLQPDEIRAGVARLPDVLRGRLMARRGPLEAVIGVRVPAPQLVSGCVPACAARCAGRKG